MSVLSEQIKCGNYTLGIREHLVKTGLLEKRIEERQQRFLTDLVKEIAFNKIKDALAGTDELKSILKRLRARELDPYSAVNEILKNLTVEL